MVEYFAKTTTDRPLGISTEAGTEDEHYGLNSLTSGVFGSVNMAGSSWFHPQFLFATFSYAVCFVIAARLVLALEQDPLTRSNNTAVGEFTSSLSA